MHIVDLNFKPNLMSKYSFLNDYSEGTHPKILDALVKHNLVQQDGYGNDVYSEEAKHLIKEQIKAPNAEITFVSGGTQANLIVISSILRPHESVISADTGHIALREAGAIEATGHKINTCVHESGKLNTERIHQILIEHDFGPHVVKPKLLYISNSTEIGTVYTKKELQTLYTFAQNNNLYVFMDGARLGAALMAKNTDVTIEDIAKYTDVFTIGGTKNGALLGEAIVITNPDLQPDFLFHIKQKGAMLAKGRFLGLQFKTLFTDNLYFDLATHANQMALKISEAITEAGFSFLTEPESNQLFPILPNQVIEKLEENFIFYRWKQYDDQHSILRLVASWATNEKAVDKFIKQLKSF